MSKALSGNVIRVVGSPSQTPAFMSRDVMGGIERGSGWKQVGVLRSRADRRGRGARGRSLSSLSCRLAPDVERGERRLLQARRVYKRHSDKLRTSGWMAVAVELGLSQGISIGWPVAGVRHDASCRHPRAASWHVRVEPNVVSYGRSVNPAAPGREAVAGVA